MPIKRILQGAPPDEVATAGSIDRPDVLGVVAAYARTRRLAVGARG